MSFRRRVDNPTSIVREIGGGEVNGAAVKVGFISEIGKELREFV